MDEKGCYAGNVTPQTIQRSFRGLGEQMLVAMRAELDMRLPATAPAPDNDPLQQLAEPGDYPLFTWGGKMHRLPEVFELSRRGDATNPPLQRTAQQCYTMWHVPHAWTGTYNGEEKTLKLPPLCVVPASDFSDPNQRKRRSDWKRVCEGFNRLLTREGEVVPARMSEAQCARLFAKAFTLMRTLVSEHHPSAVKRRTAHQIRAAALKVSTLYNDMRKLKQFMP